MTLCLVPGGFSPSDGLDFPTITGAEGFDFEWVVGAGAFLFGLRSGAGGADGSGYPGGGGRNKDGIIPGTVRGSTMFGLLMFAYVKVLGPRGARMLIPKFPDAPFGTILRCWGGG